nr:PREDICTED: extracellular calcium-sensing receptor [Anolis carolinensis]|eukprot:XP_016854403.1 PREDICTED: extracellular calcium-sensing receptor [Anolis carolinensis]
MVFAIEEINSASSLLPNITLGFRIFDSCQSVSRALWGTMQFLSGHQNAIPNFHCQHVPPQAGLIAEAGMTESRAIASVLNLYRYPQISYFDTGSMTNDKSQFPSFFRTIPSNKFQALGITHLVIYFAWKWVGLLATDSEYGKQGIEIVQEEIIKKRVCVAFLSWLPLSIDMVRVRDVVRTIMASHARVIVAFCGLEIHPLLLELYQQKVEGRVLLCSEAVGQASTFKDPKAFFMFDGSLSVVSHKRPVPGLRDFLLGLQPVTSSKDIFIQEFWSKVFNCWWNQSYVQEEHVSRYCTGKENLKKDTNPFASMPGFGLTFSVYNAVYAIAHALHDMMEQEEPRGPKNIVNRTQVGSHGFNLWKLHQYLRRVYFKNKVGEEVYFDEHGDPPALFDIYNTRLASADSLKFVRVGQVKPSQSKELIINDSAIVWTGGRTEAVCPWGDLKPDRCLEDQWPDQGQTMCLPKKELFLAFHEPLGASLASASVCGSIMPIMILAIFIAHQETPLVRANSRELSYLLLIGLALSSLCCLLFLGQPSHTSCLLRQVVFGMTFALCLSCILAKTILAASSNSCYVLSGP